jgi:class 3 adenylate cyclase
MSGFATKSLLGKDENDRREFKEAEALRRPANIGREVVGFLNAGGGDIWIGVEEKEGRAVGFQQIADIDRSLISLRDHLIETVEPQYQTDEVELDPKDGLIHVTVEKGKNPPYAQRDGGRRFWIRIGARLREMSREEIGKKFAEAFKAHSTREDRVAEIAKKLRKDQASVALEKPELWLRLVPTESLNIDLNDEQNKKQFRTWLTDPSATGNRRSGWDFVHDMRAPRFLGDQVRHGNDDDYMRTQITEQGHVTFRVSSDNLRQPTGAVPNLAPYALVEYPVSVFRLMAAILGRHGEAHANLQVVAGLVISGIRGWSLSPGSPQEPVRHWGGPKAFENDVLEIDPERLVFAANDLKENPDRCGLRVVRLIYGRFGFESGAILPEFDQQQGRLLLG